MAEGCKGKEPPLLTAGREMEEEEEEEAVEARAVCGEDERGRANSSSTVFSWPVMLDLLPLALDLPVPTRDEASDEALLMVLQRLFPVERKLPKEIEPLALMKGVPRGC